MPNKNHEELREKIEEVIPFGIWHDVPSGYERLIDRVENLFKSLLAARDAEVEEKIRQMAKEPQLPPDYENGYNHALKDVLSLLSKKE